MKKGTFGDMQVQLFLGNVNNRCCRLIHDETAWDDLRVHSPHPTTLVRDVFDCLQPNTQLALLDIVHNFTAMGLQYGDPFGLDKEIGA